MPLHLNGVFFHFMVEIPTEETFEGFEDANVSFLTPEGNWDPHTDVHTRNEDTQTLCKRIGLLLEVMSLSFVPSSL